MSWKSKVIGGFGAADIIFARHPNDRDRAKIAIREAKAAGATIEDFKKEMIYHCYNNVLAKELLKDHIDEQLKTLEAMW